MRQRYPSIIILLVLALPLVLGQSYPPYYPQANQPPAIEDINVYPNEIHIGEEISLVIHVSDDTGIASIVVDSGHGTEEATCANRTECTRTIAMPGEEQGGSYTYTVTVTDLDGVSTDDHVVVNVRYQCLDQDADSVCDSEEDALCVGQTEDDLPERNGCVVYAFVDGCHVAGLDDGTGVCDEQVSYSCGEGGDVRLKRVLTYCSAGTGECDGEQETREELVESCTEGTRCVEGEEACVPEDAAPEPQETAEEAETTGIGQFSLLVDSQPLGESLSIAPGQQLHLEVDVPADRWIADVQTDSDNPAVLGIVDQIFSMAGDAERLRSRSYTAPETMPGGTSEVNLAIALMDVDGNVEWVNYSLTVETQGSETLGAALGLLDEDTYDEIRNALSPKIFPPVPKEMTPEDLKRLDLSPIGLTPADIDAGNYKLDFLGDVPATQGEQVEDIPLFEEQGEIAVEVEKTAKAYRLANPADGRAMTFTKVHLAISAGMSAYDMQGAEAIPKDVAQDIGHLEFLFPVYVLQDDPIVKWNLGYVPDGQQPQQAYIVDKQVEKLETETVVTAKKVSLTARVIGKLVKHRWLALGALVLVVIGGIVGWRKRKGPKAAKQHKAPKRAKKDGSKQEKTVDEKQG